MDNRRDYVSFDPYYFEKQTRTQRAISLRDTFEHIYKTNLWGGADSVSGEGSSRIQTEHLESELSRLFGHLGIQVILDLPCGDFSWMQNVDLGPARYIGADIVPDIIASNQSQYGSPKHQFLTCDLTSDALPAADLLLCRDCLVHLSFADIYRALENISSSSITYFLTTTFPDHELNEDICTGDWRLLNLETPPFCFPSPLLMLNERCTEGKGRYPDKSLALWHVKDMPGLG